MKCKKARYSRRIGVRNGAPLLGRMALGSERSADKDEVIEELVVPYEFTFTLVDLAFENSLESVSTT